MTTTAAPATRTAPLAATTHMARPVVVTPTAGLTRITSAHPRAIISSRAILTALRTETTSARATRMATLTVITLVRTTPTATLAVTTATVPRTRTTLAQAIPTAALAGMTATTPRTRTTITRRAVTTSVPATKATIPSAPLTMTMTSVHLAEVTRTALQVVITLARATPMGRLTAMTPTGEETRMGPSAPGMLITDLRIREGGNSTVAKNPGEGRQCTWKQ